MVTNTEMWFCLRSLSLRQSQGGWDGGGGGGVTHARTHMHTLPPTPPPPHTHTYAHCLLPTHTHTHIYITKGYWTWVALTYVTSSSQPTNHMVLKRFSLARNYRAVHANQLIKLPHSSLSDLFHESHCGSLSSAQHYCHIIFYLICFKCHIACLR